MSMSQSPPHHNGQGCLNLCPSSLTLTLPLGGTEQRNCLVTGPAPLSTPFLISRGEKHGTTSTRSGHHTPITFTVTSTGSPSGRRCCLVVIKGTCFRLFIVYIKCNEKNLKSSQMAGSNSKIEWKAGMKLLEFFHFAGLGKQKGVDPPTVYKTGFLHVRKLSFLFSDSKINLGFSFPQRHL